MFPHGSGFVLVFDYMLSDLAEVVRNPERPLTEVNISTLVLFVTYVGIWNRFFLVSPRLKSRAT